MFLSSAVRKCREINKVSENTLVWRNLEFSKREHRRKSSVDYSIVLTSAIIGIGLPQMLEILIEIEFSTLQRRWVIPESSSSFLCTVRENLAKTGNSIKGNRWTGGYPIQSGPIGPNGYLPSPQPATCCYLTLSPPEARQKTRRFWTF